MFKSFGHVSNSQAIKELTTFLGVNVTLSCFKPFSLNQTVIFELSIHLTFGERQLFGIIRGVIFSFDNPFDSYSMIIFVITVAIVKVFKIG